MANYALTHSSSTKGRMLSKRNNWETATCREDRKARKAKEKIAFARWIWRELGECDPDPYWLDDPYWHGGWEHELTGVEGVRFYSAGSHPAGIITLRS